MRTAGEVTAVPHIAVISVTPGNLAEISPVCDTTAAAVLLDDQLNVIPFICLPDAS